jgi:hypothetical protein
VGGTPREVKRCVQCGAFIEIADDLYYSPCNEESPGMSEVRVLNRRTGVDRSYFHAQTRDLGTVSGLAVSPDGRSILYAQTVSRGQDLMLIENFR